MPERSKRTPTREERNAAIRALRGILRTKPSEPSSTRKTENWKAEDRDLERRRDERLAALFKK